MYNYNQTDKSDQQYQAAYEKAEQRVKAKLDFYWHLASYVTVIGFLMLVYLATGLLPGNYTYPWFIWPMLGWGVGLTFHFLAVFVFNQNGSEQARRRMIEQEMQRMGTYNPPVGGSNYYGPSGFPPTGSSTGPLPNDSTLRPD